MVTGVGDKVGAEKGGHLQVQQDQAQDAEYQTPGH